MGKFTAISRKTAGPNSVKAGKWSNYFVLEGYTTKARCENE
jgi:hypothetical protein